MNMFAAPLEYAARMNKREGQVLWADPSPNAKSLVESRLSGRLHINSQILVAGAGFEPATFGL